MIAAGTWSNGTIKTALEMLDNRHRGQFIDFWDCQRNKLIRRRPYGENIYAKYFVFNFNNLGRFVVTHDILEVIR